jgi:uncharacterized protein YndB with AHSA1/START domain
MNQDRVERGIQIDAPPGVVWEVITEAEHIQGWFSDEVEIDLRPGGRIVLVWVGKTTEHGVVEAVEPPHRFSFRWIRGSAPEATDENSTLVEFGLTPQDGGTHLRVVETGFSTLAWPEESRRKEVESHARGWQQELGELGDYVKSARGSMGR